MGSTIENAEAIGAELRASNLDVDILPRAADRKRNG
jgi:hypothetical protein